MKMVILIPKLFAKAEISYRNKLLYFDYLPDTKSVCCHISNAGIVWQAGQTHLWNGIAFFVFKNLTNSSFVLGNFDPS